jgi:hypothetical protein
MSRKKQKWDIGDLFVIRLKDGEYGTAQVVGQERDALNSVTVAFFDKKLSTPEQLLDCLLPATTVFSVALSTRDLLDRGHWKVVGHRDVAIPDHLCPFEELRNSGWVGAVIHGSAILNDFVNAYFGLQPWDEYLDPAYFDKLLLPSVQRPAHVIVTKPVPTKVPG